MTGDRANQAGTIVFAGSHVEAATLVGATHSANRRPCSQSGEEYPAENHTVTGVPINGRRRA